MIRIRKPRGFTLIELIVVISIILILMGMLVSAIVGGRGQIKVKLADAQMDTIVMALESYKYDFDAYPPDNNPTSVGGEILWYYLDRKITVGDRHFGPMLESPSIKILDKGGPYKEVMSPLGGHYEYKLIDDGNGNLNRYKLVDPGPDKILGGNINPATGWVKTGPESDDNLFRQANPK